MPRKPELSQSDIVQELPLACANEQAAVEFLEGKRWGDTPCCPHCGSVSVYKMSDAKTGDRNRRFLWRCRDCKKQYTVRTGTVYEESLIPLHKWCHALWLASSCKNGVSALEVSRRLQITYKSALFLLHRIRHAMQPGPGTSPPLTGTVEADETYVGGKPRHPQIVDGKMKQGRNMSKPKMPVFAVVQRGGEVRARVMPNVTAESVKEALLEEVDRGANLVTDQLKVYRRVGAPFASHGRVNHTRREYVDPKNPDIHTNTVEGFFSRLKRKLHGTHHAVSKEHLHRYVAEAAYLYNTRTLNDGERVLRVIRDAEGKRLRYRGPIADNV